uniref:Ig-like domain-containing protein n=1 Tax=Myripristis murdjan TaxID=586833 RepID=A0A667WXZ1_9TELE
SNSTYSARLGSTLLVFDVPLKPVNVEEGEKLSLKCHVSMGEVKWFKDGNEITPSKNILIQSDGKKRMLIIKRAAKSNIGAYTCDCGTDKTTADLNIEGNACSRAILPLQSRPQNYSLFAVIPSLLAAAHLSPILAPHRRYQMNTPVSGCHFVPQSDSVAACEA